MRATRDPTRGGDRRHRLHFPTAIWTVRGIVCRVKGLELS